MRLSSFELSQEQLFYQPCLSSRFSLLFLRFVFISVFLSLICVCVGFWEGDWPAKKVFSKFGELTKKVSCSTEVKERGEIFSKKHFQNTTCKGKMDLVASWQGKIKLPSFTFDETQANSKQNQSSWLWKVEIDSLKNFWQLAVVSRFKISLDLKAEGDWCELETNAWTKKLVWRVCFLVVFNVTTPHFKEIQPHKIWLVTVFKEIQPQKKSELFHSQEPCGTRFLHTRKKKTIFERAMQVRKGPAPVLRLG